MSNASERRGRRKFSDEFKVDALALAVVTMSVAPQTMPQTSTARTASVRAVVMI